MTFATTNRLIQCTSPYLLQHAHNPVDWFPWSDEALRKAKIEDKPIFLSVGYSACHWCHVMERESFENAEIAELLNRHFVPIKVDREERPDLDDVYMGAVQAMTGRGGWPMSVWLTPDLQPFYGGTYFPPESRFGFPGFKPLLKGIAEAWHEKREAVLADSKRLTEAIQFQARIEPGTSLPPEQAMDEALEELRRSFDPTWGGFSPAPKFPPFLAIDQLLRRGKQGDRRMALRTLDAMADGGIHDHLGGGFARYSVDAQWLVPHFEKMLYDNAQLAFTYLSAFLATNTPPYAEVARDTLDYLLRDMRDDSGGFYSSEDADSEGVEGRFFVFTPQEVGSVLGTEDGELFCRRFGITLQGNFEGGASVLHRFNADEEQVDPEHLKTLRKRMWRAREDRVHPHKDDKVLASWNGLALSAMARGFQVLGDPRYLEAAISCAGFIERELFRDGVLLRTWRKEKAHTPGFLEDYGAVIIGLVDLYETNFEERWIHLAGQLTETMRVQFEDPEGGFFSTRDGQPDVILRQKPVFDHSLPSANALAALALLRTGHHLHRQEFLESAEKTLIALAPMIAQAPRSSLGLLQGLELAIQGPVEIVINGNKDDPRTKQLVETVWRSHIPRRLIVVAHDAASRSRHPDRISIDGIPTAYVCMNRACMAPVTTPEALQTLLPRHI